MVEIALILLRSFGVDGQLCADDLGVIVPGQSFIEMFNQWSLGNAHFFRTFLCLFGIYVERGIIDIDMTMEELRIDDISPQLTAAEKGATVRDLLLSRSGVYHEAGGEAQSMIDARPVRGSHLPGSFFYYNNWDFNALGTIFEQVTGEDVFDACYKVIALPIGMEDFSPDDCTYQYEPLKSRHPSYFFRMSTRDMARFGLLYQRYGTWNGRQIVPEEWIIESTSIYPGSNNSSDPYGYLWRIIPVEVRRGYTLPRRIEGPP